MKKYMVLILALVCSISLAAQSGTVVPGEYRFKAGADLLNIMVKSSTKKGVVFEVEVTVIGVSELITDRDTGRPSAEFKNSDGILHNVKGLITDRDYGRPLLEFKNSDGILHLVKLANERQFKNEKGYLRFKSKKGTTSYKYVKGNLSLPGWKDGVAVVAIRHDE